MVFWNKNFIASWQVYGKINIAYGILKFCQKFAVRYLANIMLELFAILCLIELCYPLDSENSICLRWFSFMIMSVIF